MLINGIDISTFKAKQLNVDIQPSTINISREWVKKSLLPTSLGKYISFKPIKVELLFQNETKDKVLLDVSNLMSKITDLVDLTLDGYSHKFRCFMDNSSIEKTIDNRVLKLLLEFQGFEYGNEVVETANRVSTKSINVTGNLETPAIVEITPSIDIIDITIQGLDINPIVVKNLKQGKKVIINGEEGIILQDGVNKFADTVMWDFPKLKPGTNTITFSKNSCDLSIKYKPRWV